MLPRGIRNNNPRSKINKTKGRPQRSTFLLVVSKIAIFAKLAQHFCKIGTKIREKICIFADEYKTIKL